VTSLMYCEYLRKLSDCLSRTVHMMAGSQTALLFVTSIFYAYCVCIDTNVYLYEWSLFCMSACETDTVVATCEFGIDIHLSMLIGFLHNSFTYLWQVHVSV